MLLIAPNVNDTLVIQKLSTTAAGELAVDSLLLDSRQPVPELRASLIDIYLKATNERQASKATKDQLKQAKTALSGLTKTLKCLESASTRGGDVLRMILEGSPLDDNKGDRELNEFASACSKIRMELIRSCLAR